METRSPVAPAWYRSTTYPAWLFAALIAWFSLWCWRPEHPQDFLLEHILTVVFVGLLLMTRRRFPLSHLSYTLIWLFLCLHIVGAFYTYSLVPYERWAANAAAMVGIADFSLSQTLGFERNHFDRLVHFAFGLLMVYPAREVFLRIAEAKGFWSYYLPIDLMMACSLLYELLEWGVAMVFAADVGQSYLGTQGDVWDAQKDMALATGGALLGMVVVALINGRWQRDFIREFNDSLRVKHPVPNASAPL